MKDGRLNERQRMFAEEYHNVLENFLIKKRLPVDEFYDVVVFRFLKAVKHYDEHEYLKQYEFSDIADKFMQSAISNYFDAKRRKNDGVRLLSLDYKISGSNLTFADIVADETIDICNEICEKINCIPSEYGFLHTYPKCNKATAVAVEEVM